MIILNILRETDTTTTSILLYGDPSFSAETPTYSIYLLTTYYAQKDLNLLFLQRLDSYLKSSKIQFPSPLDLFSLYSFISILLFFRSSRYAKLLLHLVVVIFYVLYACFRIYYLYKKKTNNPYFYCTPPRNISDKDTITRDLCTFLHASLISYTTFDEELVIPTANDTGICKLIINSIPNNWKH